MQSPWWAEAGKENGGWAGTSPRVFEVSTDHWTPKTGRRFSFQFPKNATEGMPSKKRHTWLASFRPFGFPFKPGQRVPSGGPSWLELLQRTPDLRINGGQGASLPCSKRWVSFLVGTEHQEMSSHPNTPFIASAGDGSPAMAAGSGQPHLPGGTRQASQGVMAKTKSGPES